jgi:hypothetical protein
MAYALPADILETWPKVHTSGLSHEEIRSVEERVRSRIDAALAHRYSVPFATEPTATPPIIKTLAIEGVVIDILNRRPNTPDWVSSLLESWMETLKQLREGDMLVVGTTGAILDTLSNSRPQSTTSTYTPTFGVERSDGEEVDSDRVDAEDDARD